MEASLDTVATSPAMSAAPAFELDALLNDFLLNLVLIAGSSNDATHETGSQLVQWVHSSDLVDPSPFLAPRTVLLTTGTQFGEAPDHAAMHEYVQGLVGAGVTALGVGVGLQWERIPPALISACETYRLPLIRVPYDTPFLAVVRTASQLLSATRATDWGRETVALPSRLSRTERLIAGESALRSAVLTLLRHERRDLAEQIAATALPALPRGAVVVLSYADPLPSPCARELAPITLETDGVLSASHTDGSIIVSEVGPAAEIRRVLAHHGVSSGVSERGRLGELAELIEQADRAATLARQNESGEPLAYRPDMHAGVLQLLSASPEAVRRARGLLSPLRRHDERHGDVLVHSLATWLQHNAQISNAAQQLGVHRHTLRARVQTAGALLQRDLDDPDTRAELWVALSVLGGSRP